MNVFPKTVIIRHRRENLKKCTLQGLEERPDIQFFKYPISTSLPPLNGYLLLKLNAPLLSEADADYGLLILDGTWRYVARMEKLLPISTLIARSLPPTLETAYPRKQEDCPDPQKGLASIEALHAAYHLMGRETKGLLDQYHWKATFLEKNRHLW